MLIHVGLMIVMLSADTAAMPNELNEIENPSFEYGDWDPEGWVFSDKRQYAYDRLWTEEDAHSGDRCLKIGRYFDTSSWEYLQWGPKKRFPVNPDKTYLLSLWYKMELGLYTNSLQARLMLYHGDGAYKGNQYWWLDAPTTWTKTEILVQNLSVAPDVDNIAIRFYLERCPGWVWVDDVVWREATDADIHRVQNSRNELKIPPISMAGKGQNLPVSKAKGDWRTEKINDVWWLIKPDGKAFWSLGMVTIGHRNPVINSQSTAWIMRHYSGNPELSKMDFTSLKSMYDEDVRKFMGKHFQDYRKANIEYDKHCIRRAVRWGFNTTCSAHGNRSVYYEMQQAGEKILPIVNAAMLSHVQQYVKPDGTQGWRDVPDEYILKDPNATLSAYSQAGRVADPFNVSWAIQADTSMDVLVHYDDYFSQSVKDRHPCGGNVSDDKLPIMGYFADNEPRYFNMWNHLWSTACSNEFLTRLENKYGTIKKLNKAWSSKYKKYRFGSFEEIRKNPPRPKWFDDPILPDFLQMERAVFEKQQEVEKRIVKKYGPNRMYLSNRFESRGLSEVLRFMDVFSDCDAMCMDIYPSFIQHAFSRAEINVLKAMYELTGRPVWVTEWSVNGRDTIPKGLDSYQRGWVDTQEDRGIVYQNVIAQLINTSFVIGANFFNWHNFRADRPAYGFINFGVVDANDEPYWPLVNKMIETNNKASACARRNVHDGIHIWSDRSSDSGRLGTDWLYRKNMKRNMR